MKGQILFLGTGASTGIPLIGCDCLVCRSTSPFNQRLRPSILVIIGSKQFLVDAGPDFRQQALRYHIKTVDGLLFTHAHHDHTAGIDDLRPIYYKRNKPLPALLSAETAEEIKMRYYYIFKPEQVYDKFMTRIELHILPALEGKIDFEGISIEYMSYQQGRMTVNGFRFGDLVYLSDIRVFSPILFKHLTGINTLIVSALRYTPSPLHFSVDEAVDFATQVGAKTVWLTHLSHELDHDKTNAYLPPHVRLAYDGLEINFWMYNDRKEGTG